MATLAGVRGGKALEILVRDDALALVAEAVVEARRDHGPFTTDPMRAISILAEEVGEAAADALDMTRALTPANHRRTHRTALRDELAQVAAVAIMFLERICTDLNDEGTYGVYRGRGPECF